jgi:HEAT repeat protein
MKTTKSISLAILLLILASAFIWLTLRSHHPEPSYKGKTASEWLRLHARGLSTETTDAFLKLGTNAIPAIVHGYQQAGNTSRDWKSWAYEKLPAKLKQRITRPFSPTELAQASRDITSQLPAQTRRAIAAQALPYLLQKFANPKTPDRGFFLDDYILELEPDVKVVRDICLKGLTDSDPHVRMISLGGLVRYRLTKENVPLITRMLDDPQSDVRNVAAQALSRAGPTAKAAVPKLEALLNAPGLSNVVAVALWDIDRQTNTVLSVATNLSVLRHEQEAHRVLGEIGAPAKIAVPALLDVVKTTNNTFLAPPHRYDLFMEDVIRVAACRTIRKLDPTMEPDLLPYLTEMLNNNKYIPPIIYIDVLNMLAEMKDHATPALPDIQRKLTYRDTQVRTAATNALKAISPTERAAVK